MYCSKCGAYLPDESNFCTKCGVNVAETNKEITEQLKKIQVQNAIKQEDADSKKRAFIFLCILASIFILVAIYVNQTKYVCHDCGKETGVAYYDPFEIDVYRCEECERKYMDPFPYAGYKVD